MAADIRQAVAYGAKSTADTHGSIATQLADCRAMAGREGWDVAGEYTDEAHSGWSGDRGPGLAAAMEHAERAKGVLLVQHTDRLARGDGVKARHLIELYLWAAKAGVALRSVQDDATCENLIMAAVMGERNSEDSRRKSLAVAAGMKRRAEAGKPNEARGPTATPTPQTEAGSTPWLPRP
jgi:DNA invertase Pin-like site-specific DNA recombinase